MIVMLFHTVYHIPWRNSDTLYFQIKNDNDISLLEIFVKGLDDHCKSTRPQVESFELGGDHAHDYSKQCLYWLNRANDLTEIEKISLETKVFKSAIAQY